jgi:hypothetical protein
MQRLHDYSAPEFHHAYVNALWTNLAAYGWEKFSAAGRGVIYLHSFYTFPDRRVAAQTEYIAAVNVTGEELTRMVREYDPVEAIVVLFGLSDGSGVPYTFVPGPGQLSPFEAYRQNDNR